MNIQIGTFPAASNGAQLESLAQSPFVAWQKQEMKHLLKSSQYVSSDSKL